MNKLKFTTSIFTFLIICITAGYVFSFSNKDSTFPTETYSDPVLSNEANDCIITVAESVISCINNANSYNFLVAMEAENTSGLQFMIQLGDFEYGPYSYGAFPVSINAYIPGPLNTIEIYAIGDEDCNYSLEVQLPDCSCGVSEFSYDFLECTANDFIITIDFEYQGNQIFTLSDDDGNNLGTFIIDQLPVTVTIPQNGISNGHLNIFFPATECMSYQMIQKPFCNGSCHIFNPTLTASDCDAEGQYSLTFDFDYENPSDSFYIITWYYDQQIYGPFAYTNLPVEISGLEADGNNMVINIVDDEPDPELDCIWGIDYEVPSCLNPDECTINEIILEVTCNNDLNYDLTIDLDIENPQDNQMSVFIAYLGVQGTFSVNDFPLTFENVTINEDSTWVEIYDVNSFDCNGTQGLNLPECLPDMFCVGFENLISGENYGNLESGDTLTIENDIVVTVVGYEGMIFEYIEVDTTPFCGPFPLSIGNNVFMANGLNFDFNAITGNNLGTVSFDFHSCAQNGSLSVNGGDFVDFYYFSTLDTTFTLTSGHIVNIIRNPVITGEGTVTIEGEINALSIQGIELALDNICFAPAPPTCEIGTLQVSNSPCSQDDIYTAFLDFDFANASDSFTVNIFGQYFGTFAYSDLPIAIGSYDYSQIQTLSVTVIDAENQDCNREALYEVDCSGNNDCNIEGLIVEAYDCDPQGQFLVDLTFNYQNTSDSFTVIGNGTNYGTFAYSDLFITLGPIEGNGQNLEFIVTDQENGDCSFFTELTAPDCVPELCMISGFEVSTPECNPNGTVDFTFNFDVQNPGNDFFDLFDGNGDLVGFYPLNALPLTIDNYEIPSNNLEDFTVCINDMPDCCAVFTVEFPNCEEDCFIGGLTIEPFCDGNSLYAEISFDHNDEVSDQFQIISCFPIDTLTYNMTGTYIIQIPDALVNCAGGDFIPIGVFDLNDMSCGDTEFLFIPPCYDTGCSIQEITTIVQDCNNDDEFFVIIDFDFEDVGDNGFSVIGNGEDYGDFEYTQLPVTLGPFSGNGQVLEFIVFDNDDDECWNVTGITAPLCEDVLTTCIEFEGLTDGLNYGGPYSEPGDLLMIENNVYVTLEGVPDPLGGLNYDYMFATTQDICNSFDAASGNRLFMFNGLRFNFEYLTQNPTLVSFPFHNCGFPFAISVNDQPFVNFLLPQSDTTFNLSPSVVIDIQLDPGNPEQGVITLQGFVQSFFIGGVELQIDNVCFNVENLLSDVWPGDANFDNIANNFDLLNIGIAYDFEGPERDMINIDWLAMPADNWTQFYADDETNYKHADCNGDGEVNQADQGAILENYNFQHGDTAIFVQLPGTPDDPPFFVDLPDAESIELGIPFEAPITLGTVDLPVEEIYGIAFTVEFDPEMMAENEVSIELGSSWMGIDGQNLIHLNKIFANDGKIEVAITRTNQDDIGGFGPVGHFIGIIDDILGKSELEVRISRVKAIQYNETPVPLNLPVETIELITDIPTAPMKGEIDIFPNPVIDQINIHNRSKEPIFAIKVYNTLGQLMHIISQPQAIETINVNHWAAGIYFIKLESANQTFTKRFKKTTD